MHRRGLITGLAAGLGFFGAAAAAGRSPASSAAPGLSAPLRLPPPLQAGSRLVAVAPGTWWENPDQEARLLQRRCAEAGWTLEVPAAATGRWRWFSGTDASRRAQLERAWADPATDAVLCVAGGWGSARILEAGWRPSARPLWLVGFSDASALLLALVRAGNGGAVHGSVGGDAAQWQRLVSLLRAEPLPPLVGEGWVAGVATGPLVVSNLTVATSLIGTPWFPSLKGCVLLLEDVGEAPYRVDRMLTQWRSAGLLQQVAGIGVGRFSWRPDELLPGDLGLEEVLRERLADLGVPVVGGLPVGHGRPNLALPLGRLARLDGSKGQLTVL